MDEYNVTNDIWAIIILFNPDMSLMDKAYNSICCQVSKIIYVDNYSKNRIEELTWAEGKNNVSFVLMDDNEGIGAAQNAGLRLALSEGASHVIFFDQDSVIDTGFVQKLCEAEKNAICDGLNVGLTGPIYKTLDDSFEYPIWSLEKGKFVMIPLDRLDNYSVVSHIIASGSLIRSEVVEKIGLLREDWFIGFIDFEYCFRATQYGYSSIVTKKACMRHMMGDRQIVIKGRKIGLYSPFRRYFDCRNTILIQNEAVFPRVFKKRYLKLIIGKVIISLIYGPSRLKQFRYCMKGFYDGLRGISGKCTVS